jgi:hypothetical protein
MSEAERSGRTDYRSEYRAGRQMTLLDKLYRDGAITHARYRAGIEFRKLCETNTPRSEGVSTYGDSRHADPTAKADRKGQRYTGFKVELDGTISQGRRRSRANERFLEDAVFALVGLHDQEGTKKFNPELFQVMYAACCESETPLTQKAITLRLTRYYGEQSKQTPAYAVGVVDTLLGRLELHFGFAK